MRRRSFWFAFIALLMLAVSLSACLPPVPGSPSVGIYPAFAPFVSSCGGTAQLGQPISDPFSTSDNSICQYFENVIICEPANKPDEIYLHNLGQIYNPYPYSDAAVTVDPVFEPLYNTICGPAVLGNPISPRKYNPSLERYEQYFTNGAIYYDQNSTPENARLLPLGRRALDEIHKITPTPGPNLPEDPIPEPFLPALSAATAGLDIGEPLTEAYTAPDGLWEQVYEGAVIFAAADNPHAVGLRPAAWSTNFQTSALYDPNTPYDTNTAVFITVDEATGQGQFVPIIFHTYIMSHGGYAWSGKPISTYILQQGGGYRQCFENYCLDIDLTTGQVSLARSLGDHYIQTVGYAPPVARSVPLTADRVALSFYDSEVSAGQARIVIWALDAKTAAPLAGLSGQIAITQKDGSIVSYPLPLTDATGAASLTLAIPAGYLNGEIVVYTVCLSLPNTDPKCASDGYLVWGQ